MVKIIIKQIIDAECYVRRISFNNSMVDEVIRSIKKGYDINLDEPTIDVMNIVMEAIKELW